MAATRSTTNDDVSEEKTEKKLEKSSTCKKVISTTTQLLQHAYLNSPVNFSTLTGYHYPHIPRLWSFDPFTGQFLMMCFRASRDEGNGLGVTITNAAKLADKDPSGMAYFSFLMSTALFLMKESHIQQVLKYNEDNVYDYDRSAIMAKFFGDNVILNLDSKNPLYQKKRRIMLRALFSLHSLTSPMQNILDRYMREIQESRYTIANLEDFATRITMDIICKTQLGFDNFPDETKVKLSDVIGKIITLTANPLNVALFKMQKANIPFSETKTIDNLLRKGEAILKEVIAKNTETVLAKLNELLREEDDPVFTEKDLYSQETLNLIKLFLVAGHETTARLLLYVLMLLGDPKHQATVIKLREELHAHPLPPEKWTREHLINSPLLDSIIKETLRLYPSLPILKLETKNKFTIADISLCKSKSDYDTKFAGRNRQKDVTLEKGSMLFISPYLTHRLPSLYDNPELFQPERFMENKFDVATAIYNSKFLPFSAGRRICPGRLFSIQEAALTVARTIYHFDIRTNISHPFPVKMVFNLRLDSKQIVSATFTPVIKPEFKETKDEAKRLAM